MLITSGPTLLHNPYLSVSRHDKLPELDLSLLSNLTPETSFFTYSGSLTTPPCSEGVTWYISSTLLSIDGRSYNAIKRVVGTNNRFTQNRLGESNLLAATQAPPPG